MVRLRRQRWTGQQIARATGCSPATVAKHLKWLGLARLSELEPSEPARRYQRQAPGELVHLDVKKLGRIERIGHRITGNRRDTVRGAGWEFAHVAIDDASRLAYAEVLPDEGQAASSVDFGAGARLVRQTRRAGRAHHDRQRPGLPLAPLRHVVSPARHPPPAHPAL